MGPVEQAQIPGMLQSQQELNSTFSGSTRKDTAEENVSSVGPKGAWAVQQRTEMPVQWTEHERKRTVLVSSVFFLLEKRDMERFV